MARARISTTVNSDLLADARRIRPDLPDSKLVDEALAALLAQHRSAEVDDTYARAYQDFPIDQPDAWGDLASFRRGAAEA